MNIEYEATFPEVEKDVIRKKLCRWGHLGAARIFAETSGVSYASWA